MSELYPAEQVLKEYLYSVGKTWWSKILKKSIESIYKEDFDQSNEGTTSVEGPTVAGTQKIFSFVSTIINNILTEPKVCFLHSTFLMMELTVFFRFQLN